MLLGLPYARVAQLVSFITEEQGRAMRERLREQAHLGYERYLFAPTFGERELMSFDRYLRAVGLGEPRTDEDIAADQALAATHEAIADEIVALHRRQQAQGD